MPEPVTLEPVAALFTHDQLLAVLKTELRRRGWTYEFCDAMAGLPDRYTSKVFNPRVTRRLGTLSAPLLLRALGLCLVVCKMPEDATFPPIAKQSFIAKET
jgi:hypothetical protein